MMLNNLAGKAVFAACVGMFALSAEAATIAKCGLSGLCTFVTGTVSYHSNGNARSGTLYGSQIVSAGNSGLVTLKTGTSATFYADGKVNSGTLFGSQIVNVGVSGLTTFKSDTVATFHSTGNASGGTLFGSDIFRNTSNRLVTIYSGSYVRFDGQGYYY